jgi:hypothetical protein
MDSIEDYAYSGLDVRKRMYIIYTLSEWVKNVRSLIQIRIKNPNDSMITRATSMAKDPNDAKHLSHPLYEKYVVVPADNAPNHIVFVCKSHYID